MALSAKRRLFADEWILDKNASRSAEAAGYSATSAKQIGSKLLKDPAVQKHIIKRLQKISDSLEIKQEHVIAELAHAAFYDPGDVVSWSGKGVKLKDSSKLTPAQRSIVSGISETKDGIRLRFVDRLAAARDLGRYFGMFRDRLELEEKNKIPWQAVRAILAGEDVTVG